MAVYLIIKLIKECRNPPSTREDSDELTTVPSDEEASKIYEVYEKGNCVYEFKQCSNEFQVKNCLICFEDLLPENTVRKLDCQHIFHVQCIDEWIIEKIQHPSHK